MIKILWHVKSLVLYPKIVYLSYFKLRSLRWRSGSRAKTILVIQNLELQAECLYTIYLKLGPVHAHARSMCVPPPSQVLDVIGSINGLIKALVQSLKPKAH